MHQGMPDLHIWQSQGPWTQLQVLQNSGSQILCKELNP